MVTARDTARIELPSLDGPVGRRLMRLVAPGLEKAIGLDRLNDHHASIVRTGRYVEDLHGSVLDQFRCPLEVDDEDLARIPKEGPVVVVANHPFGGIEGVALAHLMNLVRPDDSRLMANYLLARIPILREAFFFVDPFGGEASQRRNLAVLRDVIDHVRGGRMMGVFPAGEVSHLRIRDRGVLDPQWSTTVARIARRTKATVVPVFFDGRNSLAFQMAGLVHPRLRTLLLVREMLTRVDHPIRVAVGTPITPERIARIEDDRELMDHFRARTYLLRGCLEQRDAASRPAIGPGPAPIALPEDPEEVRREIDALPEDSVLAASGKFKVYVADAEQIPVTLLELGRLRELTFRAVGEGTGEARDTDRFDGYYRQLLLWDADAGRLAGGYRVGPTDRIIPQHGIEGLYSHSLFEYREPLLKQIGPALELGRSFVIPDYQRTYAPLMLLWKAIGNYVVREPRYRMLFGPVSISNDYHSTSRNILIAFLQATRFLEPLSRLIRPRKKVRSRMPATARHLTGSIARDLEDVETVVNDIESGRRSIPVLLRQYLKLNGKLLAFNVDPEFGDVVDGLMLVNLPDVDPRVLRHYMGKDGVNTFLAGPQDD